VTAAERLHVFGVGFMVALVAWLFGFLVGVPLGISRGEATTCEAAGTIYRLEERDDVCVSLTVEGSQVVACPRWVR